MEIANQDLAKVLSRTNECMRRLIEAGLTYEDLQTPISNPERRGVLVSFWKGLTELEKPVEKKPIEDPILESFKSLDSSRYSYGRQSVLAFGNEVANVNKLKKDCCQKMLEIVMSCVEEKLSKRYLNTSVNRFQTYEDWYNYRHKISDKKIKNLRDLIQSCFYELFQNEKAIFGFPATNKFEEQQNMELVNILHFFQYNLFRSEHEAVSNVGGIIIIRSHYESKEKFIYSEITSRYCHDPHFV